MRDFLKALMLTITFASRMAEAEDIGRIKALFNEFEDFNEDLIVKAFDEKSEAEFLVTETEDLVDELIQEFPDWIEKRKIGEPTHEGRFIELV